MRTPSVPYYQKVSSCLAQYWLDAHQGNAKPFSYYRQLFKLGQTWRECIVKDILELPEAPGDAIILEKIKLAAKTNADSQGAKASKPASSVAQSPKPAAAVPYGNPDLSKFQPRELIAELRKRGYKGKLYYTHEIVV